MSNVHYNQFAKTIANVYDESKKAGVMCLENKTAVWEGNYLNVNGKSLSNFGTCGYLGLETDHRLIEKSIEFTYKYGTQFSASRTFIISD